MGTKQCPILSRGGKYISIYILEMPPYSGSGIPQVNWYIQQRPALLSRGNQSSSGGKHYMSGVQHQGRMYDVIVQVP